MSFRIDEHPVLDFSSSREEVSFTFNGETLKGYRGEPIITALRANGVIKLKEGMKKHTPFGPFCMQGRCCSCTMMVDGQPNVMTCVRALEAGMRVEEQGAGEAAEVFRRLPDRKVDVLQTNRVEAHKHYDLAVIGAGPAGLEAALCAKQAGVGRVIILDDKTYLGGQLKLQTHTFFGNKNLGASLRGFEIGEQMAQQLKEAQVDIKLNSMVIGLYPDGLIGFRDADSLNFVTATKIVCATGASEKFLSFEGNTLPGVMGAGGAQTFMNVHGVRPGRRAIIIGGGNIGVILAYQMTQAQVEVACIVEASDRMGAYDVHVNKIKALGIPVLTRHTILRAHGSSCVEGATLAELDADFKVKPGTEKFFAADTICLAVGLSPLSELLWQVGCDFTYAPHLGEVVLFDKYRQTTNSDVFVAGDCAVIGEASIARLEGRIAGLKAAADLGCTHPSYKEKMDEAFLLLDKIQSGSLGYKLGAGKAAVIGESYEDRFVRRPFAQRLEASDFSGKERRVIIKCDQDIPCNPCEASCKQGAIVIGGELNQQPSVCNEKCTGCGACLSACPGRAIRLVQYNADALHAAITVPYEFDPLPTVGDDVEVLDDSFHAFAKGTVLRVRPAKEKTGCAMVTFTIGKQHAFNARAFLPPAGSALKETGAKSPHVGGELFTRPYVCRCEEVTYEDVIELIRKGYTTVNEIKRIKRVGMGQCRGQSCSGIIEGILRRELNKPAAEMLQAKKERRTIFRPPLKRITLREAAALQFTDEEVRKFQELDQKMTLPLEIVNEFRPGAGRVEGQTAKDLSCKVAIIGGGITGVMTAWWLSRLGLTDVIVFEKSFMGSGQTGACLGGIRTGFNTVNKIARATKGLEVFRDAVKLIGEDVSFDQGGYVYLAFDAKQDASFRDSAVMWEKSGVPFTYVTDKNLFSNYVPGIDGDKVTSLVHFPLAGGANPFKALFAFAEDAKRNGVRFYSEHEVTSVDMKAGRVHGIEVLDKADGNIRRVRAEHVVDCGGTSSVKVAKMVGIDLSKQIWIERHGAFITEKLPLWLKPLVVSYHPELSGYWQQKQMEQGVAEGEIIACYSSRHVVKGFNNQSGIYFLSRMARAMLLCQPSLADVGIVRNFAEHYVGRESGIPVIGESPVPGFWMNIAKKGHGFMCAPGDGYALALSIIEGRRHEWISECLIDADASMAETMK